MKTTNQKWIDQCRKYMFAFFDYLPTKYEANQSEWKVRKFIWGFKDGKFSRQAAELVAKKLREMFGVETQVSCSLACRQAAHGKTKSGTAVFRMKFAAWLAPLTLTMLSA